MTKDEIEISRGIKCNNDNLLWPLQRAIREWQIAIEHYCYDAEGNDAPYWFGERANVSMLAAGAWKGGMIALQEYDTDKRPKDGQKPSEPGTYAQRCDLFIWDPTYGFQIEAKRELLDANSTQAEIKKTIDLRLQAACDDAHRNDTPKAALGCVFFVPFWPKSKSYQESPRMNISLLLNTVTSHEADLWAGCFPHECRRLQDTSIKDTHIYPGVIIGMKAGPQATFRGF